MKMHQVSDHCFAVINEKNRVCDANSGLVNWGGGVVIDTQSDLPHGRQMIKLFGKVWRDNPVVQQMLGYATTRDENLTDVVVQSFGGGAMIEILSGPTSGDYRYSQGIFAIYTNGRFEFRY